MTESGLAKGAAHWRRRRNRNQGRDQNTDSLDGDMARGAARYAARHGDADAAEKLDRWAAGDDADNVTFGGDPQ